MLVHSGMVHGLRKGPRCLLSLASTRSTSTIVAPTLLSVLASSTSTIVAPTLLSVLASSTSTIVAHTLLQQLPTYAGSDPWYGANSAILCAADDGTEQAYAQRCLRQVRRQFQTQAHGRVRGEQQCTPATVHTCKLLDSRLGLVGTPST